MSFENLTVCSACGGRCCKRIPGSTHPSEWGATVEEMVPRLVEAFRSGKWAVDWWEGDPRPDAPEWDQPGYLSCCEFVRPRMVGVDRIRHGAWGGEGPCCFLTPSGCSLAHESRPLQCKLLEPVPGAKEEEGCKIHEGGTKLDLVLAWLPFADAIVRAIDEV